MIISFFISIYIKKQGKTRIYLKLLIRFEKAYNYFVFKIYLNDSIIHNYPFKKMFNKIHYFN